MAKILTVEDDQFIQDFIHEVLAEAGHEIIDTRDSEQAWKQLQANPDIDLVLLDIMLPGRSGWDIFSELREKHPELKVMFVSAVEISKERLMALKQDGLVDYLVKPFTEDQLLGMVEETVGGKPTAAGDKE